MGFYRKKPVVVEARQWNGENAGELEEWIGESYETWIPSLSQIKIFTLKGEMTASIGDYIIKNVVGEFYPCDSHVFKKTYEKVEWK